MFSLIIYSFLILNCVFTQIIIPFTTIKENITPSYYDSSFMSSYFPSKIITSIKIGTPYQSINILIKTLRVHTLINSVQMGTYKITRFNESNSSSYIPLSDKAYNYGQPDFTFGIKSLEKINFGKNLFFENYSFILGTEDYNNHRETGVLGLQMGDSDWRVKDVNFIKQLKERNLIHNYTYFISYDDTNIDNNIINERNTGNLIIGIFPHQYDSNKYNKNNFKEFYAEIVGGSMGLKIKEAHYGKVLIHNDFKAQLAIEDNLIRGTKIFKDILYENFFKKKIDANLCMQSKFDYLDDKDLIFYYCKNSINLSEFNNIILKVDNFGINEDSNKENSNSTYLIIELNYKDLFIEFDNKYFFLMYFPERNYETDYFKLNKIIFQKYLINFNLETKKIGFYINNKINNDTTEEKNDTKKINDETEKKDGKLLPWILVGALILLVLALIGFIIYINPCKKRTKRANELMDDNYTYDEGINQN